MVKVITIMDDAYADLYRLKKAKDMSFTEIIRFLIQEREKEGRNILTFAGSVSEADIHKRTLDNIRKGRNDWGRI
ncbi:MAG: antitoxin VapB family protein [Candidatus Micrarchaeota archaeon]|nr:antitoxin VapB family protein [Candidatus Micrarchaeota archaeon]